MSYAHYDRLSTLDSSFLALEDHASHMHVGSVSVFDAAPLRGAHGGIDVDRIQAFSDVVLGRLPRFRQKLATVPLFGRPVWVDDDRFNLNYHLRFTALPAPGDIRQLKRLVGRIMSQQLDRGKPLWEMWFVEGLEGDRFAVISKVHHCMVDGVSGVDLMAGLMRPTDDPSVPPSAKWIPRPAPSALRMLVDESALRAGFPLLLARAGGDAVSQPIATLRRLGDAVGGMFEALASGLRPASPSPLNVDIGPHRRFDWTRLELATVKGIRQRLGGTLNDVVLAIVAGAMRRFLRARGEQVENLEFRAMVPVSLRAADEHGTLGNRVSFLMTRLPVGERDPAERLRRVIETTRELKGSKQAKGAEMWEELSDHTFSSLFVQMARLGARALSYNMVVTNVPGPPFPVYFLGARLREVYPLVPLFSNQALGIALFSYDGGLYWGFNADWDALPDLHEVVGEVEKQVGLLVDAASRAAAVAAPPRTSSPRPVRAGRARRSPRRPARARSFAQHRARKRGSPPYPATDVGALRGGPEQVPGSRRFSGGANRRSDG